MRGEFIDIAGERLYYYAAGSRGSGEPIVLVHGFPASGHLWLDVVAKLPAGRRVIVVDLLGYGRSDSPPNADYSISGHGERLVKLLDALRIGRACFVGNGTGGAIVEWVALHATERVSRIVLIGTSTVEGWFARPHPVTSRLYDLVLRLPVPVWFPILRGAVARFYSDPDRGHRSAEMYLTRFATPAGAKILRRHLSQLTDGSLATILARRPEITVPVTVSQRVPWRFMPEEAPSEVAAVISSALVA